MLPEHIQSASSTDGPLKPQHETVANGGDNIITITTASINERNTPTDFDIEQIKSNQHNANTNNRTNQTTTSFLSKQQRPPADTHSASNASTEVASAERPHFQFCTASQWISFQDNVANVHHRRGRRLNGLQLPLHPLQVFGWLVLILFGLASFWVLIPSFSVEIQGPLYGLISGLYIVHVVSHLTALLLDPADRELRRVHRNDRIVPEFDRSKHTHVIENGRCHLCNIRTSSQRTKHCSVCNKCVGKFDHHCKWLNHCIGSRNYVAFLMCVVSAVIATLVIVAAVIAHVVLYYVQPEWLTFWYAKGGAATSSNGGGGGLDGSAEILAFVVNNSLNETSASNSSVFFDLTGNATENVSEFLLEDKIYLENITLPTIITDNLTSLLTERENNSVLHNLSTAATSIFLEEPGITESAIVISTNNGTASTIVGIGISDTIFLILIGFMGLLAAITAGLLLHLCFFHIYISFLGLTTYEYIRNHRQSQEAKAKNLLSALPKNGSTTHSNTHPSRKTNDCGQIYFCSSVRNPNAISPTDLQYFESRKSENDQRSAMHCCTNSREYHQTAAKTYYMCSLLAEGSASPPMSISHISGRGEDSYESEPVESDELKTFHCCSTFAATITQRKVSAATKKTTLVSDLEATTAASLSARRSYMQFTEQCTFCTFRIRSPIVTKRSSSATSTTHSLARQPHSTLQTEVSQNSKASSGGSSAEHQRCCVKAISKHQRWRRKWNCCSSVPDSPDVPNDIIAALAARHPYATAPSAGKKINATEIPVHFIQAANGDSRSNGLHTRPISPNNANFKVQNARVNNTRTWPVARLRHMLRMLSRYRRPRCRHHNVDTAADQIKQNQIRPLQLQNNANGCQHHHHHHYYDSSSPQPPSSTTTASERSSDLSNYSDSSAITTPSSTVETILPTSVIRDDTSMTYTTAPVCITLPPALPPPTRRKIPSPTDLEELADTLGFSSHSHPSSGHLVSISPAQRLPALNNIYRRQRRKHFLRTRSPTLSPIHESGLSNPTSPQPCRHNATSCSPTPTVAAAASIVVNNLCGSGEPVRKTPSNSSLHSISSNSSST